MKRELAEHGNLIQMLLKTSDEHTDLLKTLMSEKGKASLTNFVVRGQPMTKSANAAVRTGSVRGRGDRFDGKPHSEAGRRTSMASGALDIIDDPKLVVHHNGRKLNVSLLIFVSMIYSYWNYCQLITCLSNLYQSSVVTKKAKQQF
ncbi:hypothetical protein PIB30_090359 [Stylosanthes scabra]|uniref:Uncharacterized protein n=1 Tax=Stylosanthes scabra TaxID=79078 RepID=A0ABU6UT14_9FABA|nr:hypothetical protein [Stylosanthes scabra]